MNRGSLSRYHKILSAKVEPKFKSANLDRKIRQTRKILENCELCERKCRVNRFEGKLGFCRVGTEWRIFGAHSHFGEEHELVPSGTIFLLAAL